MNKKKVIKRVRLRLKFFILLLIITIAGYVFWRSIYIEKIFNIKQIEVSGLKSYQKAYLLKQINVHLEQNILFLNNSRIKKSASKLYRIKKILVNRKFPNKIEIEVSERKAIYYVCAGNNTYLVDGDGIIFASEILKNEFDLLYINDRSSAGYKLGKKVPGGDAEKIIELMRYFPTQTRKNISEVLYVNNDIVMYTVDGIKIVWGTTLEVSPEKLQILEKLPNIKKDVGPLKYIDMRYGNNPVIKSIESGE